MKLPRGGMQPVVIDLSMPTEGRTLASTWPRTVRTSLSAGYAGAVTSAITSAITGAITGAVLVRL